MGSLAGSSRAFTRAVSPRLAECQLTHLDRVPIDVSRAADQHAAYEQALRDCGAEVIRLPDLPDDPDAVFVEDTALLLGDHAVITRPGAASRASEVESTAAGLAPYFTVLRVEHGHLDGGDVLRIGRILYVGRSTRTDGAGIRALAELVAPLDFEVREAELGDCLHLKTAVTLAAPDLLICNRACIDPVQFTWTTALAVDPAEPAAANAVRANGRLILPAGNPRTAAALRERGLEVFEVDVSELQKAEAGVTCMSLMDDRGDEQ